MRINLVCPYEEKDEAKSLGARWDPGRKVWYIVDVEDLTPFAKWIPVLSRFSRDMKPKKVVKPVTTVGMNSIRLSCACKVLPWEDCEHTEMEAQREAANILGIDGFVF